MFKLIRTETIRPDARMFGQIPWETWGKWVTMDRQNRFALNAYSLLFSTPDRHRVLVNTGGGVGESRRTFRRAPRDIVPLIGDLGYDYKTVDKIVLTTLRAADTGGSTHPTASGAIVSSFPNAVYYVQHDELAAARQPNERTAELYWPDTFEPFIAAGQMMSVEGKHQIAEGVWVMYTGEPTGGHQCVMIDFGERKRFICLGDLIPTPLHIMPTLNPVWTRDPEKATNIKAEFLDLAADEGFNLIFRYTLPGEPVIYSVCKDGDGPHHGWQLNKPL